MIEFTSEHPWWTLVYAALACATLVIIVNIVADAAVRRRRG